MGGEHWRLYQFDQFRLDTEERELLRDGHRVPPEPKGFSEACSVG
jgi:hypothetical protein